MQTLPVIPVETLATTNAGRARTGNPGIVPPWLQYPVQPDEPVDPDVPRILDADPTAYVPLPIVVDEDVPHTMATAARLAQR